MKQYLLSIYQPDGVVPPPEALEPVMRNIQAFVEQMKTAGVWVFNGGLHASSTATVVRLQHGELLTTDGPYAEAKEHIGGFFVIRVADLDEALEWAGEAARILTLDGRGEVAPGLPIEVRPFQH